MSWRKITFIVVALVILLGGSAALSLLFVSMKPEPPRKPDAEIIRYVKADTVNYTNIVSPLTRNGRVVSGNEVALVAEAPGKIEPGNVDLRKGASFKQGELLAEIYKDEMELALKARKSNFLTTITTILPDLKVDYPDSFNSFMEFFKSIEIDKELPALPQFEGEQLKIFLASRNVLCKYYGIKQDEKRLARHSLFAPFDGTFSQVNFEVGAYVNTGSQIARMIRTDMLEVEVPVENKQSQWIQIGDRVRVYSGKAGEMRSGVVVRKSDFVNDNQYRSIFVKVNRTGNEKLYAGEYLTVEFPGQVIPSSMEIPRNAVFNSNEIFTVNNGKLNKREIDVIKWNEETLVFNGLEEGAIVVTEPLINVQENSPVGIAGQKNQKNRSKNQQKPE